LLLLHFDFKEPTMWPPDGLIVTQLSLSFKACLLSLLHTIQGV